MTTKILIVEDNRPNLELAIELLDAEGYEVLAAEDVATGLDLALRERPALVLMDIGLPGLNGMEALKMIRSNPLTRELKVVAMTAYSMLGDRERIMAAGFDAYVSKPFDTRAFRDLVRRMTADGGDK